MTYSGFVIPNNPKTSRIKVNNWKGSFQGGQGVDYVIFLNYDGEVAGRGPGLPRKEISFLIVPLDPAYKARLAGHLPVKK
jgi:hypothetical protein